MADATAAAAAAPPSAAVVPPVAPLPDAAPAPTAAAAVAAATSAAAATPPAIPAAPAAAAATAALPTAATHDVVFACRRCRQVLFAPRDVREHDKSKHEFSYHRMAKDRGGVATTERNHSVCTSVFLTDALPWMAEARAGVEGKLSCSKCGVRVGGFNWSGSQCSCGTWVTPALQVYKKAVDERFIARRGAVGSGGGGGGAAAGGSGGGAGGGGAGGGGGGAAGSAAAAAGRP